MSNCLEKGKKKTHSVFVWLSRDQVASVLLSDYFNLIEKYQVVIAHTHGDKRDFKKPPKNLTSSLYSI